MKRDITESGSVFELPDGLESCTREAGSAGSLAAIVEAPQVVMAECAIVSCKSALVIVGVYDEYEGVVGEEDWQDLVAELS